MYQAKQLSDSKAYHLIVCELEPGDNNRHVRFTNGSEWMKLALENRLILFSEEMPINLKSLENNWIE